MTIPLTPEEGFPIAKPIPLFASQAPASPSERRIDSQQFQKQILELLLSGCDRGESFDTFSIRVCNFLSRQLPIIAHRVDEFLSTHRKKILEIQKKGWQVLKTELGARMETEVDSEDQLTFAKFREIAVNFIIELCFEILSEMGYPQAGKHISTGTVGFNSDIDTVFIPDQDLPEEVQICEKLMFDILWNGLFGGLSGFQVDTESYLNHPGIVFETSRKISLLSSQKSLSRLELTMATIQIRRAYGDDIKGWEAYKLRQQERALDEPDLGKALMDIFVETEVFEEIVREGIYKRLVTENRDFLKKDDQDLVEKGMDQFSSEDLNRLILIILEKKPDALSKARMSYKITALLKLSIKMEINKKLLKKQEYILRSSQKISPTQYAQIQERIEELMLNIATLGAIRNCFFEESYLTQGAFSKVCATKDSQMRMRETEEHLKKIAISEKLVQSSIHRMMIISNWRMLSPSLLKIIFPNVADISLLTSKEMNHALSRLNLETLKKISAEIIKRSSTAYQEASVALQKAEIEKKYLILRLYEKKEILSKKQKSFIFTLLNRSRIAQLKEEISRLKKELESYPSESPLFSFSGEYKPIPLPSPNEQEIASSQQENLGLYFEKFFHQTRSRTSQEARVAIINTSKYSERTMAATEELLKALEPYKEKITGWESLVSRVQTTHFFTKELEKCKRKVSLPYLSTLEMLKKDLTSKFPEREAFIENDLRVLLDLSEEGGLFSLNQEFLLPEYKQAYILSHLATLGYVELQTSSGTSRSYIQTLASTNSRIDAIVAARCGIPMVQERIDSKGLVEQVVDPVLQKIHEEAVTITITTLGLESLEKIEEFNSEIEELANIVYNLCIKHKVIPIPQTTHAEFRSVVRLWQEAL